jgi:hypothetical protein
MSSDHLASHARVGEPAATHDRDDDHGGYAAHSSLGEKLFIWVAWALAAAFLAITMGAYLPGFLATSPDTDPMAPAPAAASAPVQAPAPAP